MRKTPALIVLSLVAGLFVLAEPAAANSLRADILSDLPRESGEVGFIDLQALRASPHYEPLKKRFLPARFAQFEHFVRSVGVDPENDLEWVAWTLVPPGPDHPSELFLGIAQGQFVPENVQDYFDRQKLTTGEYNGQTLFPFGRGQSPRAFQFTFLDSSTAAFGTRAALELLLDTRLGEHETLLENEWLLQRIYEVNGHQPIWVVLDETYTRLAVRQMVPEVAQFKQFSDAAERFRGAQMALTVDREVSLDFQVWFAEAADAQMFTLLLQTGLAAQSWQLQEKNPTLSTVLQRANVRNVGATVEVQVAVEEQNLRALLEQRQLLY